MGPTGPDQTKSADFVGDPGLRPQSREKVRAGPRGSGRARIVEFSLYFAIRDPSELFSTTLQQIYVTSNTNKNSSNS